MLNFGRSRTYLAIHWFPASLVSTPSHWLRSEAPRRRGQRIKNFASTIGFTQREVWTDFRDVWSNFTYFRKKKVQVVISTCTNIVVYCVQNVGYMTWQTRSSLTPKLNWQDVHAVISLLYQAWPQKCCQKISDNCIDLAWRLNLHIFNRQCNYTVGWEKKKKKNTRGIGTVLLGLVTCKKSVLWFAFTIVQKS